MTASKDEQLAGLKATVVKRGGKGLFSAASSAVAARKSATSAPSASNNDEATASRHALATFDAAFLMSAADGVLEDAEVEELAELLSALTEGGASSEDVEYLINQFAEALDQEGFDARIASVAQALDTPESRRVAYVAACGIAYLDGELHEDEEKLFERFAIAFAIPDHEAQELLDELERAIGAA